MKKFVRQQKSDNAPPDITLDFGAAAAKIARVYEPGEYRLRMIRPRYSEQPECFNCSRSRQTGIRWAC